MNNIDEFIARFESDEIIYSSWGRLVLDYIKDKLSAKGLESILKIEPCYRVKDISSLIEKAFIGIRDTITLMKLLLIK